MDGGIIEVDGYRPVQEMMEEVLAEHGHSVSECGVISTAYLLPRRNTAGRSNERKAGSREACAGSEHQLLCGRVCRVSGDGRVL